jgi:hypothetical protein
LQRQRHHHEVVDPTKRLVARELEKRWNTALERIAGFEDRIARHEVAAARCTPRLIGRR